MFFFFFGDVEKGRVEKNKLDLSLSLSSLFTPLSLTCVSGQRTMVAPFIGSGISRSAAARVQRPSTEKGERESF